MKRLYRAVVPGFVRDSRAVGYLKARLLGLDWIYDADFYEADVEGPAARSAGSISSAIVRDLRPRSVIDVGCGTGALLEALRDRGCQVFGVEYAEAALSYCRTRRLEVAKFDLRDARFRPDRRFDVAISMEVAEHLPEPVADPYVDLLTQLSSTVILTAAQPGQGGTDHLNEQPRSYWVNKFQARGFEHDAALADQWGTAWRAAGDVETCYWRNLMVFRRRPGATAERPT